MSAPPGGLEGPGGRPQGGVPGDTGRASQAADPGSLARYRLAVMSAAKRYKRYPRVAMDNNWEGRVDVRMVIDVNGMIASLTVKSGSRHTILDKQALDMIRKAKPLSPIPSALKGQSFTIDIPVIFSLEDR